MVSFTALPSSPLVTLAALLCLVHAVHTAAVFLEVTDALHGTADADASGLPVGRLEVGANEEASDAAYRFCALHPTAKCGPSSDSAKRGVLVDRLCALGAACTRRRAVVATLPVAVGTATARNVIGHVQVHEGEEPADAVLAFGRKHDLSPVERAALTARLCGHSRKHGHGRRGSGGSDSSAGESSRAVPQQQQRLPLPRCSRTRPVIFRQEFTGDGGVSLGKILLLEGEDPADAALDFARRLALPLASQQAILDAVCPPRAGADGSARGREWARDPLRTACDMSLARARSDDNDKKSQQLLATVAAVNVTDVLGRPIGVVRILRGREPADVAWVLSKRLGLSEWDFHAVVVQLCDTGMRIDGQRLTCSRRDPAPTERAVLLSQAVVDETGKNWGTLVAHEGQDVIDRADAFARTHGLPNPEATAQMLTQSLCANTAAPALALACRRRVAADLSVTVALNGAAVAAQAAGDQDRHHRGAATFTASSSSSSSTAGGDMASSSGVRTGLGRPPGRVGVGYGVGVARAQLVVRRNEEVADAVLRFGRQHFRGLGLELPRRKALVSAICSARARAAIRRSAAAMGMGQVDVKCGRGEALLYTLAVSGLTSSTGQGVSVTVLDGQEPADVVHDFVSAHLEAQVQAQWYHAILDKLCADAAAGLTCRRRLPRPKLFALGLTVNGLSAELVYRRPNVLSSLEREGEAEDLLTEEAGDGSGSGGDVPASEVNGGVGTGKDAEDPFVCVRGQVGSQCKHVVLEQAQAFCGRHFPRPPNCDADVAAAIQHEVGALLRRRGLAPGSKAAHVAGLFLLPGPLVPEAAAAAAAAAAGDAHGRVSAYDVLGVAPGADRETVAAAYARVSAAPPGIASNTTQQRQRAYEALSDDRARALHDAACVTLFDTPGLCFKQDPSTGDYLLVDRWANSFAD